MICKNCGCTIKMEEKYCSNCGQEVMYQESKNDNLYSAHGITTKKRDSRLLKTGIVLQVIVGLAFIIASFYTNYDYGKWFSSSGYSTGNSMNYSFYGGDAYTGIQQAAAQTATNVKNLSQISLYGFELTANNVGQFSWVFIQFTHIILILVGILLIVKSIKEYGKLKYEEG